MAVWLTIAALVLLPPPAVPREPAAPSAIEGVVLDARSGLPIPARVSIRGDDGTWYFPESAAADGSAVKYERKAIGNPAIVEMHATLSAHPFRVAVPPGRYVLTAERGKEYHPERLELTVGPEPVKASFRLRRWIDMAGRGWYSGDTHTHRTLDELPNVMEAEDLHLAFPLLDWVREAFVPPIARREASFRDPGSRPIAVGPTRWIVPRNTEYEIFTVGPERHTLGAFFVINHETPLDLGTPPVVPVAERARREGALIELDKHNWPWSMAIVPIMPVDLFELSNNHVWQTDFGFRQFGEPPADYMGVERDAAGFTEAGWIDFGFQNYYALLDCGFRLRPTAGTASGVHPVPLGFGRVYVRVEGEPSPDAWLKGLDAGRSFVTTGPMLLATLDGRDPGHRFEQAEPGPRAYHLKGSVESAVPVGRIEVVVNGEVAHRLPAANDTGPDGSYRCPIDAQVEVDGSSWVAVRCYEDRPDGRVRFAHSAPFHVDVAGRPLRPRKAEVAYLIGRVEAQIERSKGLLPEAAIAEYRRALEIYHRIAETAR